MNCLCEGESLRQIGVPLARRELRCAQRKKQRARSRIDRQPYYYIISGGEKEVNAGFICWNGRYDLTERARSDVITRIIVKLNAVESLYRASACVTIGLVV